MPSGIEPTTGELLKSAMDKARASQAPEARKVKEASERIRREDSVHLGSEAPPELTYPRPAAEPAHVEGNLALLRDLVARLIEEQGASLKVSVGGSEVSIRDLSAQQAAELIAEDGYFGVEQTSQRIVDFAIAVAGNDPTKIDQIRKGVEDGFNAALKAFGGELPEISWQTRSAVMDKLQSWEESFSAGT